MTHPKSTPAVWLRRLAPWLMLLLTVVFLIAAGIKPGDLVLFDNEKVSDFSTGWEQVDEAGRPVETQLPLMLPAHLEIDGTTRITKTVPVGLPYPAVLCFRTAQQKVRLYLDGELLYSFGETEIAFGKGPGSCWNLIRLPRDSEGKQLLLELSTPYQSYRGKIEKFQVGSKAALLFSILREHMLSLILTLVIFICGAVTLVAYFLVIRKDAAVGKETLYLGLFALFVSIWLFGEVRLTQFFRIPPAVNTYLTLIAMLATPIPLVKYIACGRTPTSRMILRITSDVLCGIFAVSILLQMLGVVDFIPQLPAVHTIFALCAAALLYTVISDATRHPGAEHYRLVAALGILAMFFVLEVIGLYAGDGSIGNMMRIGVLLFIALRAQLAFKNAANMMRMSRLASVDALTGCLNRTAYNQWQMELDGQHRVGVVIADINDLKLINDTYGHDTGDDAITRCAKCFSAAFSPYGRCFRIGGDEFAMLGKNLTAERMLELGKVFEEANREESKKVKYPFAISYGCAIYNPQQDQSLSDVIRRADKVMYHNKRQSKQREEPDNTAK